MLANGSPPLRENEHVQSNGVRGAQITGGAGRHREISSKGRPRGANEQPLHAHVRQGAQGSKFWTGGVQEMDSITYQLTIRGLALEVTSLPTEVSYFRGGSFLVTTVNELKNLLELGLQE